MLVEIKPYTQWYKTSGIYMIVNNQNGKTYVGSCASFKSRVGYHRCKLRGGTHDNHYLQRAWNLHGEGAFKFFVLELCPISRLSECEAYWMEKTKCFERDRGYNLDRIAVHKMHSEETKRKISIGNMGKTLSKECRKKLSIAQTGRKHLIPKSPEMRKRYSEALMGHPVSAETRAKMSAVHKGKTISEEQKAKFRITFAETIRKKRLVQKEVA